MVGQETHCLTELRANVNMLTDAPSPTPLQWRPKPGCCGLTAEYCLLVPSPTFPSHPGLQAFLGACQAHSCLSLRCCPCLEPCVTYLLGSPLQILSQKLPLWWGLLLPSSASSKHPSPAHRLPQALPFSSPALFHSTITFWHITEDPSHLSTPHSSR